MWKVQCLKLLEENIDELWGGAETWKACTGGGKDCLFDDMLHYMPEVNKVRKKSRTLFINHLTDED